MVKRKNILIGSIALGVLVSVIALNYKCNPLNSVKATSSNEVVLADKVTSKIFTNSAADKTELLNMMINSTDYFKSASGSFRYYSKNANTDMDIDFAVDIENSKSYEKSTFRNLKTKIISDPFEESVFNGEYYSMYRSDDLLATQTPTDDLTRSAAPPQFVYKKIDLPNSIEKNSRDAETIENRIETIDGEEAYVRKLETSLMGVAKTVLLPEDFAIGFMGTDLSKWNIISNEKYLDRNCVVVEPKLNAYYKEKHHAVSSRFIIDSSTGILLESHLIDSEGNDTFTTKINSLDFNQTLQTNIFDKYNNLIEEE